MKKLFSTLLVLSLFLSANAQALKIKTKRIECGYGKQKIAKSWNFNSAESKKRYFNLFFIISPDDGYAKLYQLVNPYQLDISEYNLTKDLDKISFTPNNGLYGIEYEIDRKSGKMTSPYNDKSVYTCNKMDDNFSPKFFLLKFITKNLKIKQMDNKF